MNKKKLIENLILENYNQYYRLAYSYVHNDEDAYDIVQTGACKALKASNSLKKTYKLFQKKSLMNLKHQ